MGKTLRIEFSDTDKNVIDTIEIAEGIGRLPIEFWKALILIGWEDEIPAIRLSVRGS